MTRLGPHAPASIIIGIDFGGESRCACVAMVGGHVIAEADSLDGLATALTERVARLTERLTERRERGERREAGRGE